jgi:ABC-2 type transport system ATP-binding protein
MSQTTAITLEQVSKTFGRGKKQVRAIQNLSLTIQAGQVYGFLGPNGAGKTTTIRMLLDLIRPTAGRTTIYSQDPRRQHEVLRRVGAIVEGAAFYPYLTGRRNLEVLARTSGLYDQARIDSLLEQVGLTERAGQRVSGYSTGMKQRLGLAAALLADPDLLILDEPTNGLDPAGIQEIRRFIRDLVDHHGKTVFLSSHILSEIEQVCDRVAIINHGELVREGAVAELLAGTGELRVEASPLPRAAQALDSRWPLTVNGQWMAVKADHAAIPEVVRLLVTAEVDVYQVVSQRQTLEDYFLAVTQSPEANHA